MSQRRPRPNRGVVLAAVVVLLGLAGVAVGLVVDQVHGPQWSADSGVVIRLVSPDELLLTGLAPEVKAEDLTDAAALAKSQAVLTRAAATLRPPTTWTDLAQRVEVEPVGVSHIIKITAKTADRDSATRTADAVAAAYVATTTERVHATSATLQTVPRPPDATRQGGSDVTADVRSRAVVLGQDVTIAETFHTDQPTQVVPGVRTPAALGVVGLAAGALAAVALTLLRPASGSRHGAHATGPRTTSIGDLERLVYGNGTDIGHDTTLGNGHDTALGNGNGAAVGNGFAGSVRR